MKKNVYLASLQAYITVEGDKRYLGKNELDLLYASGDLTFCGDTKIEENMKVSESEGGEDDFSIDKLDLDDDTSRAFRNVLQSIKNISSFVSYARCDENIKQEIADMGEKFLMVVERKLQVEFQK